MLGLFSTLLGGLMGGLGSMMGSQANYAQNAELMHRQNQYNIDMWKMNNEYNTPQAQMQRFQDAGLNPNLIYNMGTPGNSSSSPQQGVPAPMDHKFAEKLLSAFNIENLKKVRADRQKAEADADNARTDATRNSRQLFAEEHFGQNYVYNMQSGQYEVRPQDPSGTATVVHPSALYTNQILANNYNRAHLIPYRQALLEHDLKYLIPQIQMKEYESRYYPWSFWIDRANTGTRAVGNLISSVVPFFGGGSAAKGAKAFTRGRFIAPNGRAYNY